MTGYYEEETYRGATQIHCYNTEAGGIEMQILTDLVCRWGMVAGQDGGEDSAGRAKIRLAMPEELITRAVETTKLLVEAAREQKWLIPIPAPKPAQKEAKV